MKNKIGVWLRAVWKSLVLPMILLLPRRRQMQLRTFAHYTKLTLWHGHVIDFDGAPTQDNSASPPQTALEYDEEIVPVSSPVDSLKRVLPDWAINELRELGKIEPQLYPTDEFIGKFHHWATPVEREAGDVYATCLGELGDYYPDIIILVPWLTPGGADRGVLHHVAAALRLGKKVLVIATVNAQSPWSNQMPAKSKFIELGLLGSHLSEIQRLAILTRIVLQSPAKVIHVINSQLGWEMIQHHGKSLIATDKKIFASVFCDDYDYHGALRSYPQMYLVDCWKLLNGLICDTRWYPQDLKRQHGVSLEKIRTIYFPILAEASPVYRAKSNKNVLWAGRFAKQKRLDLLIEITKLLPEVSFDIYGYAVHEHESAMEDALRQLPNVTVHGVFSSMDTLISANEYSLFLYTSAWDGLPLTLLDATMAGLPIVASAVGGVPEFINEETGYPVIDIDNPAAYAARINEAIGDDEVKHQKWNTAVELIFSRHTADHFTEQVSDIDGYINNN
jgi:glycosyltransferase involved in cell wall biosynthesis